MSSPDVFRPGPHRVALLAAAFTLPLLFVGGSVTSYGVGMAVPDWPTTFGVNMFLYNFWNEPFGVRLEHTHRLYGSAVGLATIVLAAWLIAFDRRPWLKVMGGIALAAVIAQGIMGGLRVARISTTLAAFHGAFGQAFFGYMVALCVLTGRVWHDAGPRRPDPARLRIGSALMLALVYSQVVVGAWFRHFGSLTALMTHAILALAVISHAVILYVRIGRRLADLSTLRPASRALMLTVTLQVLLGVGALGLMLPLGGNPRTPTLWQAMLRTAHQTNGALLLGAAVVLALRTFRLFEPSTSLDEPSTTRTGSGSRTPLEAIA